MRRPSTLLLVLLAASLASCRNGRDQADAVGRPREGGTEIDAPEGGFKAVAGQTIYVPAYSSILTSDLPRDLELAVMLSIRNTDRDRPIILTSARYFDHDGRLVLDYLRKPLRLGPMAATELFVRERDTRGGISASFLLEWVSEAPVSAPLVESVMTSTASAQGIAFTCPGRVVLDRGPAPPDQR